MHNTRIRTFEEWLLGFKRRNRKKRFKRQSSEGYPLVYCPEHPRSWRTGYVNESMWMWENYNKACLLGWARVFHKDGNKNNNKRDNLRVISTDYDRVRHIHDFMT